LPGASEIRRGEPGGGSSDAYESLDWIPVFMGMTFDYEIIIFHNQSSYLKIPATSKHRLCHESYVYEEHGLSDVLQLGSRQTNT